MRHTPPTFAERNNLLGTTEEVLQHMFGAPDLGFAHIKDYRWALFLWQTYGTETFKTPKEPGNVR